MAEFKVGDKVRCVEGYDDSWSIDEGLVYGKIYTVLNLSDVGTLSLEEVTYAQGEGHPFWHERRFLLEVAAESRVLDSFKTALDNLRNAGYDVKVTVTQTVTEEL